MFNNKYLLTIYCMCTPMGRTRGYYYRFAVTNSTTGRCVFIREISSDDDCSACRKFGLMIDSDRCDCNDCVATDFPSRCCCKGKLWWGVSKDARSSNSLRKALVRKVREMNVVVNWRILCWSLEKDANCPWEKVASGKHRTWKKVDFSCLPVVGDRLRNC